MQSSAQILVQRYLEGDLNDFERQAFLEDMSGDPQLAALVEHEAQLDHSIINDVYSIEPPVEIRAAVLASIAASQEPLHHASRSIILSSALSTFVSLWLATVGTSDNDWMSNALRSVAGEPALTTMNAITAAPTHKPPVRLSSRSTTPDEFAQANESAFVEVAEQSDVRIQSVGIEPAIMKELHQQHSYMQLPAAGLLTSESFPIHGLSGIVGPSSFGLRYDVASFDGLRFFVEGGAMGSVQQIQQFSNGIAQQTSQQSTMPFIAFGAECTIVELPLVHRQLIGSAAIGVSAAGTLAIADLIAEVTEVGLMSIYAGVRATGMTTLRGGVSTSFDIQPFIRASFTMP